jgi:hypothetical protein
MAGFDNSRQECSGGWTYAHPDLSFLSKANSQPHIAPLPCPTPAPIIGSIPVGVAETSSTQGNRRLKLAFFIVAA